MATAILLYGAFFLKRLSTIYPTVNAGDPEEVARTAHKMALSHLRQNEYERRDLYRIFFYDCRPIEKRLHHPLSKRHIDFANSEVAKFRRGLHKALHQQRKVALRLGHLPKKGNWAIHPHVQKALLNDQKALTDLGEDDLFYDIKQKGVDMRIGLDIASLAFKRQVDQIVLIAGDADFVPAAKLARREGIDFILDPLWHPIHDDLKEHIDGLQSVCPDPRRTQSPSPATGE